MLNTLARGRHRHCKLPITPPHDSTEFVGTGYDSLQAVVVPIGLRFINVDSLRLRSSKRKRQEV